MPSTSGNNFVGVEVALTNMHGVMISASGEILDRREHTYEPEKLIGAITDMTGEFAKSGNIESVGVAIPGLVNRETDRVLISTGLPFTAQEHIHAELIQATGLKAE